MPAVGHRGLISTIAQLVVLPCLAGACVAWWLIGDVSEATGDDVLVDLDALDRHSLAIGLIGVLATVVTLVAFGRSSRELQAGAVSLVVGSYALGFALGFALRVVSAHVGGANIGGGLLMLVAPVVLPVALWLLLRKAWRLTDAGSTRR